MKISNTLFQAATLTAACALLLAGCGGGGGGSEPEPPMALLADAVSLQATRGHEPDSWQNVNIYVRDDVYYIGYDTPGGLPDWLSIDGIFEENYVTVTFSVASTDMPEGTYPVVITFYALNEAQELLAQADVTVTLVVTETVAFSEDSWGPFAIYGHSTQTQTRNVTMLTAGERWQVSVDAPWVTVPAGIQEDTTELPISIDTSSFVPGNYEATIQLVNPDDPSEVDTYGIFLRVYHPNIYTTQRPFVLGGEDGLDGSPRDLNFSLNTGTNSYPWEITSITYPYLEPKDWLQLSKTSGTVSSAGDVIVVDALRDMLSPDSYSANLTVKYYVLDKVYTDFLTVTLNIEENRLYVIDNGVALHELPSRSRLSAEMQVLNSRGRLDVPWTAQSDQPWLTVTPSGTTGGSMSLQAATAGLAVDTVHIATVTISSSDAAIENEETVTVGLWKGSQDPGDIVIDAAFDEVAANPVFPYVHAAKDGVFRTYNTYTGALVSTWPLPYAQVGGMVASPDGRTVFVPDLPTVDVSTIDVASGQVSEAEVRRVYAKYNRLAYLRVKGHGVVVPSVQIFAPDLAVSPDRTRIFEVTNDENDSFSYIGSDLDYTALRGGELSEQHLDSYVGSGTGQMTTMALAGDRERVLMSVTTPNEFRLYNGVLRQQLWAIPAAGTPNNTIAHPDGRFIVGARVDDESDDIQLLDPDGNLLGLISSPAGALLDDQMALTSDRARLVAPTNQNLIGIFELPP